MHCDVMVLGASFAGSLLARILAKQGRRVLLVERVEHPRFAIGESSTPLADFLLEQIAEEFSLPNLRPLSRWGTWQETYPELVAGRKRGFSYFQHYPGMSFQESEMHESSWLVAASANDELSDTHWMRSDLDHWFLQQAQHEGVELICPAFFKGIRRRPAGNASEAWHVQIEKEGEIQEVVADVLVDSTGAAGVLPGRLGVPKLDGDLKVRSGALFGHFEGVVPMDDWLQRHGVTDVGEPFRSDDAAQHHLIEEGWVWMLRFNNGVASVGVVLENGWANKFESHTGIHQDLGCWNRIWERYPTLGELMSGARLVSPRSRQGPKLASTARLSRLWGQAAGPAWCLLPSTAGIIDPLHSTGIAHALSGVQRLARLLLSDRKQEAWKAYSQQIVQELQWIDRLIHTAYLAKHQGFPAFCAAASLYFVSAIHCERQMGELGEMQDGFLCAHHHGLRGLEEWLRSRLETVGTMALKPKELERLIEEFRQRLQPWNDVGLLDPSLNNRISRSVAPK